jgi:GNAT superfamily N-acetyltransferase
MSITLNKSATINIRSSTQDEIEELNQLIILSAKMLSLGYYSNEEIEALNQYVFGVDSELVQDQTYFSVEIDSQKVACGGWSKRATLFGGDQSNSRQNGILDPKNDAAKIRAFFVHPDFAKLGIGRQLLTHCENEAKKSGFKKAELMSTLPGVDFYAKQGYGGDHYVDYLLPNGIEVKLKPMTKIL